MMRAMKAETTLETVFDYKSAFSTRVREIINILYPQVQINIINSGISGGSAMNGYERLERDVICFNPDICVVSFGLNDSTLGEKGIENYKNALRNIFNKLSKSIGAGDRPPLGYSQRSRPSLSAKSM